MSSLACLNFWRNHITSLGPNEFHLDLLLQLQTGDPSARTLNAVCITELTWPRRSDTSIRQAFRPPKLEELQRNSEINPVGPKVLESLAQSGLKPAQGLCFQVGLSSRAIPETLQLMKNRDPEEFKNYPVWIDLETLADNFSLFRHEGQHGAPLVKTNQGLDPGMDTEFARTLKFIRLDTDILSRPTHPPRLIENLMPFGHEIPLWG